MIGEYVEVVAAGSPIRIVPANKAMRRLLERPAPVNMASVSLKLFNR